MIDVAVIKKFAGNIGKLLANLATLNFLEVRRLQREADKREAELASLRVVTPDFAFIGYFTSPQLMQAILDLVLSIDASSAQSANVMCDFPIYGVLTHNDIFLKYHTALSTMVSKQTKRFVFIFNSYDSNKRLFENQFSSSSWESFRSQRSVGLIRVLSHPELRASTLNAGILTSEEYQKIVSGGLATLSRTKFIDIMLKYNEFVIQELKNLGATVRRYPKPVPVHLWYSKSGSSTSGIMTISDARAMYHEPGFRFSGSIGSILDDLFAGILSESIE